jgi:mannose-6-phosphate isomerase
MPPDAPAVASLYSSRAAQQLPDGQRLGEVWLTGDNSRIGNGPHAGRTLAELAQLCGPSLLGNGGGDRGAVATDLVMPPRAHPSGQPVFPLLVKFLFTSDKLSVQLHPPDTVAARRGSWGKTEMWHILHAEPGARLAVGFREGLAERDCTSQALRQAALSGAIEQMLDWREVDAGETFFVPAGTVHAIGGGLTICEIQQNSDITYRLYDYNRPGTDGRPRPLHLDEALEVIEWRTLGGQTDPTALDGGENRRSLLAACPYFMTERWEVHQSFQTAGQGRVEVWIGLGGSAELDVNGSRALCESGEVVVIPADSASFTLHPLGSATLLRTYQPDWGRDVAAPLCSAGFSESLLRRVAFSMAVGQGAER